MNAILQNAWEATKRTAWRAAVRTLRKAVDAADEWTHAQEVALRSALAPEPTPAQDPAVDRKASADRERAIVKAGRAARPRQPRLVYQHGEFVRREA